ncbi:MAG: FAD-dependent oxidoreductase [Paracoccaceae bacterium]
MTGLPAHASVVVVGGGVMGCSTLYHLAREGVADAVLLERDQLTSGTTWHSAGQVRALRSSRNITELVKYSAALYATLEQETGQATGWINRGAITIATSPERVIHLRRQEALAHLHGIRAEWISAGEAGERWPLMRTDDVLGAVWSPEDGRVSPSDLCAALVKGARARGARVFEATGVTGILTRGGRVHGVETARGTVRCDAIALCAGLWSRAAAAMAGAAAPVWPCEHFYLLTKAVEGISGNLPTLGDHDGQLYIRDDSGGLLVGCFEPAARAIPPEMIGQLRPFQLLAEDWDHFEPMMRNALHRLPALETAEVKMLLNGPESFTPDGTFLLGETAETRGLFLGCGMNSVGVATGGGGGMALAHWIRHGHPPASLSEAEPNRFPDCFNSAEALAARAPEQLGRHYDIAYPGRQMSSARNLRRLPLQDRWEAARAHFGQFYGWERPLYFRKAADPELTFGRPAWFDQVGAEVTQAHTGAALFDLSGFGKIEVEGRDAEKFLNRVCANDMTRAPGSAVYTAMLNPRGGYESDVTVHRLGGEHYRIFTGTVTIRRDLGWLGRHLDDARVALRDSTADFAVIGLMGPEAARVADEVGASALNDLGYFRLGEVEIAGAHVRAVRLSYVGEAGWEITTAAADAGRVHDALQAAGARPAGLYAQTSMRIEKGYRAMGHELDSDVTPPEAGLAFTIAWDSDFIGREALMRRRGEGVASRIVTILLDDIDAVPLGNEPVYEQGRIVGRTTSAAFGYRVGCPLALAEVEAGLDEGAPVAIDIARQHFAGRITLKPAFDPTGARMRKAKGARP